MTIKSDIHFNEAINAFALSPDKNILGVFGDCVQAELIDMRTERKITSLIGHEDFGFSIAWHPNGLYIATGN